MQQNKTCMEQIQDKHPNMDRITICNICGHDLRYDNKIHRIDMEWYCDKCYIKYKLQPLLITQEIKENLKIDEIILKIREGLKNKFWHPCPNCENWTTENVYEFKDKYLFHCYWCGIYFRER